VTWHLYEGSGYLPMPPIGGAIGGGLGGGMADAERRMPSKARSMFAMLGALGDCETWGALRRHRALREAFAALPEPNAAPDATDSTELPAPLKKLCTFALLGRRVAFDQCVQRLHAQIQRLGDDGRRACVPGALALEFAKRATAWLPTVTAASPRCESSAPSLRCGRSAPWDPCELDSHFQTALLAADVLSILLHRLAGHALEDAAPLAAARCGLISWLNTWLDDAMKRHAADEEVIAAWLPALSSRAQHGALSSTLSSRAHEGATWPPGGGAEYSGGDSLHASTCALLNARRLESGSFVPLFQMASSVPLHRLDDLLQPDADALLRRHGIEVRFPGAESASPNGSANGSPNGSPSGSPSGSPNGSPRHSGVRRALGGKWLCKLATPHATEPVCLELLMTTACMRGHAPRVRFVPPIDHPLVHAATGLLSPLALEYMHRWMFSGESTLPTPAAIVDFVEMFLRFTRSCQLPAGLVEQCSVNEASLAEYMASPRTKRMRV